MLLVRYEANGGGNMSIFKPVALASLG